MMRIISAAQGVEREPLAAPFGFKGGYLTELWQSVVRLTGESGRQATGLGVQSILWSDPDVFAAVGELAGNRYMREMTRFALEEARRLAFATPFELQNELLPRVYAYGKQVTGNERLRLTFALNSLVAVDHAAWLLYAAETGAASFDAMLPEAYRPALAHRHTAVAGIPVVAYGTTEDELTRMLDAGSFVLKIKVGADPDKDGDPEKMLEWDKRQLSFVHRVAGERTTAYTASGRIAYYMDANGRYDSIDRVARLLEHADRIGALERIVLFEEPFPEQLKLDVSGLPVAMVGDESVHDEADAIERIALGYRAFALKPIAKTTTMSLKIAKLAHERGIPCFCADLTVNPLMVDWNKNMAARLAPLPGFAIGLLESNGPQNYSHWQTMRSYHPMGDASWTQTGDDGVFRLDGDFYAQSGGVFRTSEHYDRVAESGGAAVPE
ncbi:enolase-like domain-containing protein [Paenibacillus cymbidii]|uniref:L-alanine-DL-glutamate epimerase n=1 Tax=Paenibacillus cymbidii TaxID=1639034 RepID=UPI00108150CC|nr:L-alanine-DL-glutamate epimerase [Paenibacillus cymbidii]